MRKAKTKMILSQSMLEYLLVLTAIVVVIAAHTFAHFGIRRGVQRSLEDLQQDLNGIIHGDNPGETVNIGAEQNQWYNQKTLALSKEGR